MEFFLKKTKTVKSQSILEYLIVLAAILVVIIINTVGFSTGVQNSLGLQNSLNTTQNAIETTVIRNAAPSSKVASEPYYKAPEEITSNPNNTDEYRQPPYTGGYDYDEWIKNHPDSGYINRTGNSVSQPGANNRALAGNNS